MSWRQYNRIEPHASSYRSLKRSSKTLGLQTYRSGKDSFEIFGRENHEVGKILQSVLEAVSLIVTATRIGQKKKQIRAVRPELLVLLRKNLVDVAKDARKIEGKNVAVYCPEVGSRILDGTWEMIAAPVESCSASVGDSLLKTIASNEEKIYGKSGSFW